MLNFASIAIGLVLTVVVLIGLLPFLGWINWFALVIGATGILAGALSRHKAGLIFNVVLVLIAAGRLSLGGGLF